jgi:hypothetical protein
VIEVVAFETLVEQVVDEPVHVPVNVPVDIANAARVASVEGVESVNALAAVAEPPEVFITTSFAPTVPDGVVTVTEVDELTVTLVADVPPTVTAVDSEKLVPVIVTEVPPETSPVEGVKEVNVGPDAVVVRVNVAVPVKLVGPVPVKV